MKLHLLYSQTVIQVNSTNNIIGRNETYGIFDAEISRKHLLVDQLNNTILHTGTTKAYLNDKVIPNTAVPIVNGDRIKLSSNLEILVEITFEISDESDYVVGSGLEEDADPIDVKYDLEELPDTSDFNYTESPKKGIPKPKKRSTAYGLFSQSVKGTANEKREKFNALSKGEKGKWKDAAVKHNTQLEESDSEERPVKKRQRVNKTRKVKVQSESEMSVEEASATGSDPFDTVESTQPNEISLAQMGYSLTQPILTEPQESDSEATKDLDVPVGTQKQTGQDDDSATASLSDSEMVM
ncbi:hypothetical protein HDV01_004724 [Terramyces sp. JEL0728]|nr:hypothetical protein HDV01_004724 [Terramyces sp. JEL0728]